MRKKVVRDDRTKNSDIYRKGTYSLEAKGGTLAKGEKDFEYVYASINRVAQGTFPSNGMQKSSTG